MDLTEKIQMVVQVINDSLIPKVVSAENSIFLQKLLGDYHRYMAEFTEGNVKMDAAKAAENAYQQALNMATKPTTKTPGDGGLSQCHPLRLGIVLNFACF